MGILSRFTEIISANINALLEKAEDPVKMVNQYLLDAKSDLADVKQETAEVMAKEAAAKRKLDANTLDVAKYTELAKKALLAGSEADASVFVAKKQNLETTGAALQVEYAAAHDNAIKMRQLYDKLSADVAELEKRKAAIEAKMAIANTQEKVNKYSTSGDKVEEALGAFAKMEAKADAMLDKADAMAKLDAVSEVMTAEQLEAKYAPSVSESVSDELAALKAELGL